MSFFGWNRTFFSHIHYIIFLTKRKDCCFFFVNSLNNIKIYFNITNKTYCIIISDTKKFREEFNKYKEKVKDNSDYKNMLNDYKNMSEEENEY